MINNLNMKISSENRWRPQEFYKTLISVGLGILGFIGTFFALRIEVNQFNLDFVWSLIFPMLVTQAWGVKYGLLSSVIGLSAFHSFYLWQNEGWACFVGFFSTIVWFVLHGYGAEKRKQSKRYIYNIYFIEIFYSLINSIIYFFLFPLSIKYNIHFWYKDVITIVNIGDIRIFSIKRIVQGFFILIVCDVLLLLPSVKKLFLFNVESKSRHNGIILAKALVIGTVFCLLLIVVEYLLPLKDNSKVLAQVVDTRDIIYIIFLMAFCMFAAGITMSYVEKKYRAEELVRKSERKYHDIFDKMISGMIITEPIYGEANELVDMIAIKANPAIEKHLGIKVSDVIGNTYIKLSGGNKSRLEMLENILKNDKPARFEIFSESFNRYLLVNVFKVNNKQIGIMFQDITELKELQNNFEAVFESTDNMIFSIDRNYNIINFNSSLKDFMKRNYDVDIKNGASIFESVPHEIAQKWKVFYDNALSKGKQNFEYYIEGKDRYIELVFNPISENEEVFGIAVFAEDITKRKEAEQKLVNINQELEQAVEERTRELRSTLKELEAFTYTVSHDLKSPLRAIDGYSRIILEDYEETFEEEVIKMITNISNVSCDMINFIDRLLQYSTTSKASIKKDKVDMEEVFVTVFDELKATCIERNIQFNIQTAIPSVIADKIFIKQLIYNILSNAIKFTKNKEITIINVGFWQDYNERVFYIEDNGVGFDMKYSKKLFGMFQRLHNKEDYEGSGIGLATVHKIIQKHGGRTWIESKLNKGTRIYFTLPIE